MIKFSFIIPVKEINAYIQEAVAQILVIPRDDYEIIIYPDAVSADTWPKTRQIATGHVGPAAKRTRAISEAQGEILIFIDDDAYPAGNFLDVLMVDFREEKVLAVGGPALTPEGDNFWAKVSGAVFLSSLSGGYPDRYVPVGRKRPVQDWPSVNFSIRKSIFTELEGFQSEYWPGEDTKLCLDLITKYPDSIIYDPALIVFHHRRAGLFRHLKQISGYGLHRGFFAKKYPATSCHFKYFIPSAWLLYLIGGAILAGFISGLRPWYYAGLILYALALIKAAYDISRREKNWLVVLNSLYYIFFTHLVYGWFFIKGLIFIKNLKSKLR